MTEEIQDKMDAELEAAEAAIPAADPAPVVDTPTLLFLRNFVDIFSVFKEFSGVGKSVKAPAAKELVSIAAQHANVFTQIELGMGK